MRPERNIKKKCIAIRSITLLLYDIIIAKVSSAKGWPGGVTGIKLLKTGMKVMKTKNILARLLNEHVRRMREQRPKNLEEGGIAI